MKKNQFIVFLILICLLFIGSIIYEAIDSKASTKKIALFNLKLTGRVIKKKEFVYGHDYGFLLIDIKKSNYGDFDSRNKEEDDCFFIIKKNKCLLVISGVSEIYSGDIIVINKDKYSLSRNNKIILKNFDLVILPSMYCDNPDSMLD